MRIIGGQWKGRPLTAPPGSGTRPTTDRVREAVFSSLYSILGDLDDVSALDLYAGSGALGIEALSRGARHVTFVERDRRALAAIRKNLASVEAPPERWQVVQTDASRLATASPGPAAALLFADPPYTIVPAEEWQVLEALGSSGWLSPGCIVVYEHRWDSAAAPRQGFVLISQKRYGDTGVSFARYEG
ncbi:16S rRNA (guanine(966)-N(2))-methyltransferase RsmD [Anaerosoma tenue]|uniref:16S rRNA (guanine(966)-N(2))-methyltransferase RsmD n=1 Tax=Anaerosoma tenue TaxID=2933588 RepID=UPI002260A3CC|nr:16S rRNA (guanine(966)-N(2))-methyltransferase RsmD [Anaerosoma tenue]MCK8114177.1 16S rRNA (guanine(966)-N(2))-methyltransferase RsmD [Anaerosoma tenue]